MPTIGPMSPTKSGGNNLPREPLTEFARKVKELRLARGLSHREAGELAGVSGPAWVRLEKTHEVVTRNGVRRTRIVGHDRETVIKVARALNWDVSEALRLAHHTPVLDVNSAPATPSAVEDTSKPVNTSAAASRTWELLGLIRDIAATPAHQIGEVVRVIKWVLGLSPAQRQHLLGFAAPSTEGQEVVNPGLDITPEEDDNDSSEGLNGA